ncbi:hypothetical protein AVEN_169435-1, partial [Araneus ventricosus]
PGGGKTQEPSQLLVFDHWEQRRLVVGHPGVRLASGVEGKRSSTLEVGDKDRMLDGERGRAVKNRLGGSNLVSDSGSADRELCDQFGFKVPN